MSATNLRYLYVTVKAEKYHRHNLGNCTKMITFVALSHLLHRVEPELFSHFAAVPVEP